jgi:hypothetical protein
MCRAFLQWAKSVPAPSSQAAPLLKLHLQNFKGIFSLSFLSAPRLAALIELQVFRCDPLLPISELQHIRQLRALQICKVTKVFERALTEQEAAPYQPPSQAMPALRVFSVLK